MRTGVLTFLALGTLASGAGGWSGVGAQELRREVARAEDGTVTFHYAVSDHVEICRNGIRTGGSRHYGRWPSERDDECVRGVAQVRLRLRDGVVTDLELLPLRGGRSGVDLGERSPSDAADYLLWVAETENADVAEDAILPATLADGVETWPRVLVVARDRSRPEEVREQAVFWLGQAAADAATIGLGEIAADNTEDDDVRDAAVFALSQRPAPESVRILMELAERSDHAKVRRSALFWLAQSNEDVVVDFFERILRGG
jgi:HEAT repeat protein